MAGKAYTVEDVLRFIQIVRKDMEYLHGLEEKWREQKERFPVIYEGIIKQREALKLKIAKLRQMRVMFEVEELEMLPTHAMEPPRPAAAKKEEAPKATTKKQEAEKKVPAKKEEAVTAKKAKQTKAKRRLGIKA